MPNSPSAKKRLRQDAVRRLRNRQKKSRLATNEKKFRASLASGDLAQAEQYLTKTLSLYDKAAKTNVVHANKVDRKKARLTAAYRAATQA